MKNKLLFILALVLGLGPFLLLFLLFFFSWFSPAFLAYNFRFESISFYLIVILPVILIGIVILLISYIINRKTSMGSHLITFLAVVVSPYITYLILPLHGKLSSRAYLKIENRSGKEIPVISVTEPDNSKSFGLLKDKDNIIVYYYPDYGTYNGKQYAGISENYLHLQLQDTVIRTKIPTTHPGELNHLILDNYFGLESKISNY